MLYKHQAYYQNNLSKFIMSKIRKSKIIANPQKVPCSLTDEGFTVKLVGLYYFYHAWPFCKMYLVHSLPTTNIKNYELRPPIISSFSKKLVTYWNISLSFTFRVCSMAFSEATSETIFQKKSSCFMDMVKVTISGETGF